jgi:hypothetical protein
MHVGPHTPTQTHWPDDPKPEKTDTKPPQPLKPRRVKETGKPEKVREMG